MMKMRLVAALLAIWTGLACAADPSPMVCSQVPESFDVKTPWTKWSTYPPGTLQPAAQGAPSDRNDLSGQVVLAWNSRYLFIVANIVDDVFQATDTASQFWNGDSLQIGIDQKDDTPHEIQYNADDILLGVADFGFGPKVLAIPPVIPPGLPEPIWPVPLHITRDGANRTYVLALPWRFVPQINPLLDRRFRFSLLVNDNDGDGTGRRAWLQTSEGIVHQKGGGFYNRVRLERSDQAGPMVHIAPPPGGQVELGDDITLPVTVRGARGEAELTLQAGHVKKQLPLPASDVAMMTVTLPAVQLGVGQFTVTARYGEAKTTTRIEVFDSDRAHRQLESALQALSDARKIIALQQEDGRTVDYYQLRANLLDHAIRVLRLGQRGGYTDPAGRRIPFPRIVARARDYLIRRAPNLLADVQQFADNPRAVGREIPSPDLYQPWTIRGGNIYIGDTPITLHGVVWLDMVKDPRYSLYAVGMNMQTADLGARSFMPEPWTIREDLTASGLVRRVISALKEGEQNGEVFDIHTSPHYFPRWFRQHMGEQINWYAWMNTPEGRKLLEMQLAGQAEIYNPFRSTKTIDLANEWFFTDASPAALEAFREWLKRRHRTIGRLNDAWGTALEDFGQIGSPFPEKYAVPAGPYRHRGALWDWCNFTAETAADVAGFMNSRAKHYMPGRLTHLKCIFSSRAHITLARQFIRGLDPQRLLPITDMIGTDASYIRGDLWKSTLFIYDYLKSICPDKPIICAESHTIPYNGSAPGEIRRGFFQRFIHGERIQLLFLNTSTTEPQWWGKDPQGEGRGFENWNISSYPDSFHALAMTSADLRRLTPEVSGFEKRAPDMLMFYDLAADFDVPDTPDSQMNLYSSRAIRVYDTLLNRDLKIGVVTEAMLDNPDHPVWRNARLPRQPIILAGAQYISDPPVRALKKHLAAGGWIVWMGENLRFDQYGRPRPARSVDALRTSPRVVQLPAIDQAVPDWAPLISTMKVEPPFSADSNGKAVKGLEILSAPWDDGRSLVFLANTTGRVIEFALTSRNGAIGSARDTITRRRINAQAIGMRPDDVLLLEITPVK